MGMMILELLLYLNYQYPQRKKRYPQNNVQDHAFDTLFKLSIIHSDGKSLSYMLVQQQSIQMDNIFAEQQVNNNKAKTKQEQLSLPQSQVLKTYDFGNFENCEINTEIF